MRVIGRRELSSLEPFDLILLIVLGDAVQQGLTQDDYSLTGAFLAIGVPRTISPDVLVSAHDPEKWTPVFGQDHAHTKGRLRRLRNGF